MNLKLVVFITAVVFIIGSLVLAIWYRMNEDEED
jgi:hypothetical protein|tara:strand:+ start:275 stop:376 length:102 start_codon:yes stop_codon:yes gene_type:complete